MKTTRSFDRRALLCSTGAGLALAPFVPLARDPAWAQPAAGPPKRLVFFYSSNGTVRERWLPKVDAGRLTLSEILAPLETWKQKLLVVDGLGYNIPGWQGHETGMILTAARGKKPDGKNSWSLGVSLDQRVAEAIGATTKFRSLECGIQSSGAATWNSAISYRKPYEPMRAENSPYKVFSRVFADLAPAPAGDAAREQARLDRGSVIDRVKGDLARLQTRLGVDDRRKLEGHLDHVREIERTLATGAPTACQSPTVGTPIDIDKNDNIPTLGRLQIDLLVAALACDLTRVGTVQFGPGGAYHRFSWLGKEFLSDPDNGPSDGTTGFHGLAHNEGTADSRAKLAKIHAWYAGELAYLLDRLAAIPEGGGTMADNTLVVWMNELGTGSHSFKNTPWVLAGALGGALRTGALVSAPGQSHGRLLLAIARAFGLPDTTFGDPEYGDQPLAGVLA